MGRGYLLWVFHLLNVLFFISDSRSISHWLVAERTKYKNVYSLRSDGFRKCFPHMNTDLGQNVQLPVQLSDGLACAKFSRIHFPATDPR